jgi:DNA-binding NarL/FixJ family response regulator
VLTTFDDDDVLFGALGAGAAGFVLKNSGPEEIVDAVRRVAAGDAVLDRSVHRRVFARFDLAGTASRTSDAFERLTERERDVLWLVAQGLTNQEVADRLGVGEATAKTHVSRVLAKLGVRDRVQAVIVAHQLGFASTRRALG